MRGTIESENLNFHFLNPAKRLDYKYYFLRRLLFEKKQHLGDCGIAGRL